MSLNLPDLPEVCQMPLEKAVGEIITKRARHGDCISMDWLTRNLRVERRSTAFNYRIRKLRGVLEPLGFRLNIAGMDGKGYRILGKMETVDFVADRDRRRAEQTLADAQLLNAIDGSDLSPSDAAKLQHSQAKAMNTYRNMMNLLSQNSLPQLKAVEPLPLLKAPDALKEAQEISQRSTTCLDVSNPGKP